MRVAPQIVSFEFGRARRQDFAGFGATSPSTGGDCPAGGDWNNWCDCMWAAPDDPMNTKCKSKPWGFATPAPWTDVGAGVRGIPKPGSLIAAAVENITTGQAQINIQSPGTTAAGGATTTGPGAASGTGGSGSPGGLFDAPETIAKVGIGVLAVGIGAYFAFGRKKKGRR